MFFADKTLHLLKNEEFKKDISQHLIYYYLGSIIPDSFYYRKDTDTISERIHGKGGYESNKMAFALLENVKQERDLIFTFGYLTHCALDITFHPAIDFFSGAEKKEGFSDTESTSYIHMHMETELDAMLNQHFFMDKMLNATLIEQTNFPKTITQEFSLPSAEVKKTLSRQLFLNHMFRLKYGLLLFSILNRLGIINDKPKKGLFYANLKKEKSFLKSGLQYRTSSGEIKTFDINEHLATAASRAEQFIEAASAYAKGKLTKEECAKVISFTKLSP